MKLTLQRLATTPGYTHGSLLVDDEFECYTLEDTVRADGVKIHGETAIPAGVYRVEITWSPRFKRDLPLLLDVANFVGIRIHPGNEAKETQGCILVGQQRRENAVGQSRLAFDALFAKLQTAKARGEQIEIEITSPTS